MKSKSLLKSTLVLAAVAGITAVVAWMPRNAHTGPFHDFDIVPVVETLALKTSEETPITVEEIRNSQLAVHG